MSSKAIAARTLVVVWLAGAASYACYTLLTVVGCWRVTRRRQIPVEEPITALTTGLSQRLRMRKRVRLSIVDAPLGPLSFGWLRPTIVIPQALVSSNSIDDLEPILAHELIHVRRGDGLVGVLQVLVQCLWWFHPLIWLMNRNICSERERCCDEEVIAELAYEPRRYGRSLLGVLELKQQFRLPSSVPGIRPFEVTQRRLEYLVKYSRHFQRRMPRSYWIVFFLGLFLFAPGAGLSRFENRGSAVASQPAPPKTSAPSEGWAVKGRIVDHRGVAVPKAEVLLLGEERIFVDADRRNWFVLRTEKGQPPNPPSTRTNSEGEFSIERSEGAPNRVAVISADPLFWVVSRDKLADGEKVEIKLPPSGSLAIDCDLPGKPAKQPVNIELRTFDGVNWNTDALRFHFGSFSVKNPGETVFEHLPPGKYGVQRNQETKTGDHETLIALADRKLVDVESNKRAAIRIDRKIGRPLTGRVRGLENVDLRHAHVMINYVGPEEEPGKDGKPIRYMTTFDVIPITSEGHFTTDPIPAGEYHLFLTAMRSTTSNQSPQRSDFEGQLQFTVPAEGEMPTIEVVAKPRRERDGPNAPRRGGGPAAPGAKKSTSLRVIDEQGNPIPKFEIRVWTAVRGSSIWLIGSDGQIAQNQPLWGFAEVEAIDVTVRAEGYASTIAHFAGPNRERLLRGEATVVMRRGEEVQVQFRVPPGMTWPDGLKPDVYFDDLKQDIRGMWQPSNRRAYADTGLPDLNMLNVRSESPATATVRLARDTAPFRVAIYSPGFLQLFERGPFTMADIKNSTLEIEIDKPGAFDVHFDADATDAEKLPFERATISVMWRLPETSNSYLVVASGEGTEPRQKLQIADLSAGHYMVSVRTQAKPDVKNLSGKQDNPINPGNFFESKNVSLQAAQSERIDFRYSPIDVNAFRGDRTAVVRIVKPDGSPAAGRPLTVTYFDGHYGGLEVFSGNVPESGNVTLEGITHQRAVGTSADPYTVHVDKQRLGTFGLAADSTTQEFTFRLPPAVGDMAPDVDLVNLATGTKTRLSKLRGKLVCLEFWATWCGPCREPMRKLNQLASENRDAWKDQVAIVPVSIDDASEVVTHDVKQRGLNQLEHYWSGDKEAAGWASPAARAFVVSGVPTLFIIDRDGRILWRGHPTDTSDGKDLIGRIEAALKQ